MAQKRKTDQSEVIAAAALALAGKNGWKSVSLLGIAKRTRLPLKTVEKRFVDIWAVLDWVLTKLEKDTLREAKKRLGKNWRDNLFEILMTRFDLVQRHREAYKSLPAVIARHPQKAARFSRPFCRDMKGMLDLSGLKKKEWQTPVFSLLYLSFVAAWAEDDTQDLSKTMAAIDKRLGFFEKLINQ